MGKLTLILGGARSGKSTFAERIAYERGQHVAYIATAQALDEEMKDRILAHQGNRPTDWLTLEIPKNVGKALEDNPPEADLVLLDCLTLLVTNVLLETSGSPDEINEGEAKSLVKGEIEALLTAIQSSPAEWIVVSNEVGMGLVPPYPLGRAFRDLLGWANQQLAAAADDVTLMIAGIPWRLSLASP